jgi:hypothetical protein
MNENDIDKIIKAIADRKPTKDTLWTDGILRIFASISLAIMGYLALTVDQSSKELIRLSTEVQRLQEDVKSYAEKPRFTLEEYQLRNADLERMVTRLDIESNSRSDRQTVVEDKLRDLEHRLKKLEPIKP